MDSLRPLRIVALLALGLQAACIVVHADDDAGGGGGDTSQSRRDYDVQICQQAHATFLDWGCPTSLSFDCDAHVDRWAEAGCLEEDIAWWECIDAYAGDECAQGCDFVTPTSCFTAYCADHPEAPVCASPSQP